MKNSSLLWTLLCVTALLLAACGSSTSDSRFRVGVVTNVGRIDDKAFNQSTWEGAKRAEEELGASIRYIETTDSKDFEKNIATFADAVYDVIVTVGFPLGEVTRTSAVKYPHIRFIGVDQDQYAGAIGNLAGLVFPEDQAGFLVGALAAMMTKSNTVGAVLATDDIPPLWRFGEGYRAGAHHITPVADVLVVYHNDVGFDKTFTDPEWGAATANGLIAQGSDIIFGAGGTTGNGAVIGAAQAGVYAIGVDTDQYYTLPEAHHKILSSALKLIAPGVFDLIKQAKEGTFVGGNVTGAVGYAPFHEVDADVPAAVKEKMQVISAALRDGSLKTGVPPSKDSGQTGP